MSDNRGVSVNAERLLLEVITLTADDARAAEVGGADRLELVGSMAEAGLSPKVALVEQVRAATSLPIRVMVRVNGGFRVERSQISHLRDLARRYRDAGADGLVVGFLDAAGAVDVEVLTGLVAEVSLPWTFHRAIDSAADADAAWTTVLGLPVVDQVLTAGSPDGVEMGLPTLLARASLRGAIGAAMVVGGGLRPAHVEPLAAAGVQAFHVGSPVRPAGDFAHTVARDLVVDWRRRLDASMP